MGGCLIGVNGFPFRKGSAWVVMHVMWKGRYCKRNHVGVYAVKSLRLKE